MKAIVFISVLCVCTTAYLIIDRVSVAYERSAGICPGSLGVNDYYTPGE